MWAEAAPRDPEINIPCEGSLQKNLPWMRVTVHAPIM